MERYETITDDGEILQFGKPIDARLVEAEGRAAHKHVRVTEIVPGRRYVSLSQSEPGVKYEQEKTPHGWICKGCKGYKHSGMCKHIGQVSRRAQREGWAFGQVARVGDVWQVLADWDKKQQELALERVAAEAAKQPTDSPLNMQCIECRRWFHSPDDWFVCPDCEQEMVVPSEA